MPISIIESIKKDQSEAVIGGWKDFKHADTRLSAHDILGFYSNHIVLFYRISSPADHPIVIYFPSLDKDTSRFPSSGKHHCGCIQ
jgi:hypothetical protein